jgi:hypothetical protein
MRTQFALELTARERERLHAVAAAVGLSAAEWVRVQIRKADARAKGWTK